MFVAYFVFGLLALGQFEVEGKLKITIEDINIEKMDPEYVDTAVTEAYVIENDDGVMVINSVLKLIKKPPDDIEAKFNLTGVSMGEYNLPTGIDLQMGLCDMLDEEVIMGPFLAVLGLRKDSCPPEVGTYAQEGYQLVMDKMPEEFDENKYLASFQMIRNNKILLSAKTYVDVAVVD